MEIKEHLSVYLESGYLFDDMSGKLKWFEIDKILISFTYGVVRYVGTWGGCRAEKTLDGKLFYSSEECFKKDKSIPKTKLSIYDVFKSLYGFAPIGDVWKYKNGRAVKCKLEHFDVEIDNKGKIYCKETYYRTCEDVYKLRDMILVMSLNTKILFMNILQIIIVIYFLRIYAANYCSDISTTILCHILSRASISPRNVSKSKIWDDWLQLTQYFPNKDSEYYEAAYVRYDAYNPQTEVYSGFGDTEVESRAMLLIDLLDKKVLTLSDLNLKI